MVFVSRWLRLVRSCAWCTLACALLLGAVAISCPAPAHAIPWCPDPGDPFCGDPDPCQFNSPPRINSITATPPSGTAPLGVSFSVSAYDPNGNALYYYWEFGNGATSYQPSPTYAYLSPGTYNARVTVSDDCGAGVSTAVTVQVDTNPNPTVLPPGETISAPAPGVVGGIKVAGVADPSIDDLNNDAHFARISGTNSLGQAVIFTIPINGIGNYVFFYEPTGPISERNLLTGDYRVEYLTRNRGHATVSDGGTIHYRPDAGFTLGFQARNRELNRSTPFPPGPLGIQGTVRNTSGYPVQGASVTLSQGGSQVDQVLTNANGFYSFYYTGGTDKDFVQPGHYTVTASNGTGSDASAKDYNPSTVLNRSYFVQGAGANDGGRVRDLILPPFAPIIHPDGYFGQGCGNGRPNARIAIPSYGFDVNNGVTREVIQGTIIQPCGQFARRTRGSFAFINDETGQVVYRHITNPARDNCVCHQEPESVSTGNLPAGRYRIVSSYWGYGPVIDQHLGYLIVRQYTPPPCDPPQWELDDCLRFGGYWDYSTCRCEIFDPCGGLGICW